MNPGSDKAIAAGCTCPVLDNAHGKGLQGWPDSKRSEAAFWISDDCPLHGEGTGWKPTKETDNAK